MITLIHHLRQILKCIKSKPTLRERQLQQTIANKEVIQLLTRNENWFMDGTFKLCSQICYQIYWIHILINNQIFLCLFGLLPSKTENIYNCLLMEVWNAIQNVGNNPTDILLDFERASINAVRIQMPQVLVNIKTSPTILQAAIEN